MFTSITGCKVEICGEFPNEEEKRRRKKDTKETVEEKIEAKFAKFVLKKQQQPDSNFIDQNIKKITYWNRINEQSRQEKSRLFEERRKNAVKRKEQMFLGKPILVLLSYWSISYTMLYR